MALSTRVVEVIADRGESAHPRYRYGSGCIVVGRPVLTAAHVVAGACRVEVRDPNKVVHHGRVDPQFVGDEDGPRPDLAIVEIEEPANRGDVLLPADLEPVMLARVDRDSASGAPVERCQAIGYPWFAELPGPAEERETVDAFGLIPVASGLVRGLLSLQVVGPPRPLPPIDVSLTDSEWSGMSGAPVLAGGCLLGVVTAHAPRAGPRC